MLKVERLRREAIEAAKWHGHELGKFEHTRWHGSHRFTATASCARHGAPHCGAWVMVDDNPPPNGIEIGGPAVAVDCTATVEEV